MSIYLRFNNKNYQCPNKLTIGRGLPFVSQDFSFGRDHAVILLNKKGMYLNKKNKKLQLSIDGKEITDCKSHQVTPGMKFTLGQSHFEVLATAPQEYEKIERISSNIAMTFSQEKIANLLLAWLSIYWMYLKVRGPRQSVTSYLCELGGLILIFAAIKLYFKFLSAIAQEDKFFSKDIVLAKDGMTIFFKDDKNFSFKYSDIESWSHKGMVTCINCYGKSVSVQSSAKKFFRPPTKNDQGELPYYLAQNVPLKEQKSDVYKLVILRMCTIYPFVHYGMFEWAPDSATIVYLRALGICGSFGLLIYLLSSNEKLRRIWYLYDKDNTKYLIKQNALLGIIGLCNLFCLADLYESYQDVPHVQTIAACAQGTEAKCRGVNFKIVLKTEEIYADNIQRLAKEECRSGNQDACSAMITPQKPSRDIASQKE